MEGKSISPFEDCKIQVCSHFPDSLNPLFFFRFLEGFALSPDEFPEMRFFFDPAGPAQTLGSFRLEIAGVGVVGVSRICLEPESLVSEDFH